MSEDKHNYYGNPVDPEAGSAKGDILRAAFRMFSQKGYDSTGIQEICQEAGITKPSLYYHFGNKDGLLKAVCRWVCNPFLERLEGFCKASGDLVMDLRHIMTFYRNYHLDNPREYLWIVNGIMSPRDSDTYKAMETYGSRHRELLRQFFLQTAVYHGNMKGKENYLALSFTGVINAYLFSGAPVEDKDIQQAVQHFLYGVFS